MPGSFSFCQANIQLGSLKTTAILFPDCLQNIAEKLRMTRVLPDGGWIAKHINNSVSRKQKALGGIYSMHRLATFWIRLNKGLMRVLYAKSRT
jgi:hypothetical protein